MYTSSFLKPLIPVTHVCPCFAAFAKQHRELQEIEAGALCSLQGSPLKGGTRFEIENLEHFMVQLCFSQ